MITNQVIYKTHPLYPMLRDCIMAAKGGYLTNPLQRASKISGWSHDFEEWNGMYSIESLSWNSEDIYNKLVEIYS